MLVPWGTTQLYGRIISYTIKSGSRVMNQWNVRKVLNIAHLSIPKRHLKRGDGDGDGRERKDIRVVKYPWKRHQFFLMEDACLDFWKGVYKVLDPFFLSTRCTIFQLWKGPSFLSSLSSTSFSLTWHVSPYKFNLEKSAIPSLLHGNFKYYPVSKWDYFSDMGLISLAAIFHQDPGSSRVTNQWKDIKSTRLDRFRDLFEETTLRRRLCRQLLGILRRKEWAIDSNNLTRQRKKQLPKNRDH